MFSQLSRSVNAIIQNGGLAGRILLSVPPRTSPCPQIFRAMSVHHTTRSLYIQCLKQIENVRTSHQYSPSANMSYDSSNKVHSRIHDLITKNKKRVFVFMKGTPSQPSCGYSKAVVQILDAYGIEFDSCDVFEHLDIKDQIKTYSDWPTIPQVYLDGNFIGGCDIMLEMHQSGELKKIFVDSSKSHDTK